VFFKPYNDNILFPAAKDEKRKKNIQEILLILRGCTAARLY
jgi:hypothetical protein